MDAFEDKVFPFTITVHKDEPDKFRAVMETSMDNEASPPVFGRTAAEAVGRMVQVMMDIQAAVDQLANAWGMNN